MTNDQTWISVATAAASAMGAAVYGKHGVPEAVAAAVLIWVVIMSWPALKRLPRWFNDWKDWRRYRSIDRLTERDVRKLVKKFLDLQGKMIAAGLVDTRVDGNGKIIAYVYEPNMYPLIFESYYELRMQIRAGTKNAIQLEKGKSKATDELRWRYVVWLVNDIHHNKDGGSYPSGYIYRRFRDARDAGLKRLEQLKLEISERERMKSEMKS